MISDTITPLVTMNGASHEQRLGAVDAEKLTGLTARYVAPLNEQENRGNGFRCQLGEVKPYPWQCSIRDNDGKVLHFSGTAPHFVLHAYGSTFGECVAMATRKEEK
jgi:hypothetical protein